MRHIFAPLLCLFAVLCVGAGRGAAQERIAILSESGTPVVAMEVLVAAGPANEPEGKAGLAYLAARSVTAPILPTLDSLDADLEVRAYKDALAFTLTAAPDAWEEASRLLMIALFRDPPQRDVVLRERDAIRAELLSRESNPADAAIREGDAALYGPEHPWGRPTVGFARTVETLAPTDVDGFLRNAFTSDRAVVAVVGPVDAARARTHLLSFVNPTGRLTAELGNVRPVPSPVRKDYNSITTWISVSYRFPATADVEALRLLAQLVTDEISFSLTRQSVFNARGEVLPRLEAGELRFQMVTRPEEADQWAQRILDVVGEVTHRAMLEERFDSRMRRYRGERLYELAAPEARARELARELLVNGRTDGLARDTEGLTLERLRDAVATLSAPIVVLLGPIQENTAR